MGPEQWWAAENARVQRRYADLADRGQRRAMVLAAGREATGGPVQQHPRKAAGTLQADRRRVVDATNSFQCIADSEEDVGNIDYLRDVAMQAGLDAPFIDVGAI